MKSLPTHFAFFLYDRETRANIGALLKYLVLLVVVIALYSALFHVIMHRVEGQQHSWLTGIYWTLTVMSTLGFGDITFTSDIGRAFSTLVLLSGIFMLLVLLPFLFIRLFYGPWLEARVRNSAPRGLAKEVAGHVIICTYDDITPGLIGRLRTHGIPYIVIESDPARAARMHAEGIAVVTGEVDDIETYRRLNVERARLVFANLNDAANTNITLTVRELSAEVPIAALAFEHDSIDILELSGATEVLQLKQRLGEQLANRVNAGHAQAHVLGRYENVVVAEFPVHNTPLVGRTIRDSRVRQAAGVSIIGVWERGRLLPAQPDAVLTSMSVPVVVGTEEQIEQLNEFLVIYEANFNPVIVIGGGRVGRAAAQSLEAAGVTVHMIERNPEMRQRIGEIPHRLFLGDAADRELLRKAGLDEAPSVVITTHDDATNIYLAAYCQRLHPEARIISRITHERNVAAVLRAGADLVLSYASLGAESIIALLRGRELLVLGEGFDAFRLPVPRSLAGRTIADSQIRARTGATIVAIRADGRLIPNPTPDVRIPGDAELLLLAPSEQRDRFLAQFG
ncbi:MAG: potassium channel family protein [Longimicrobiales bacterium]